MPTTCYTDDHEAFRQTVRDFLAKEVVPHLPDWDHAGLVPRDLYTKLGELGVPGLQIPEE